MTDTVLLPQYSPHATQNPAPRHMGESPATSRKTSRASVPRAPPDSSPVLVPPLRDDILKRKDSLVDFPVLRHGRPISLLSSSTGNLLPSVATSNFTKIFEAATQEFMTVTGQDLSTHIFSAALDHFKTPDAIVDVFRNQARVFEKLSKDNEKLMTALSPIVQILFTLSATIGELQVSPPSLLLYMKEVLFVSFSDTIARKGDLYRRWCSSGG
jgi:hypothetical protein